MGTPTRVSDVIPARRAFSKVDFLISIPFHLNDGLAAREGKPSLLILLYLDSHPGWEVAHIRVFWHRLDRPE